MTQFFFNSYVNMQKFLMSIKSDEPNISTGKPVGYIGIVIILMYVVHVMIKSVLTLYVSGFQRKLYIHFHPCFDYKYTNSHRNT